jgi:5-formyltetrahydrofolate cyclo-ligase
MMVRSKDVIREEIWEALTREGVARSPGAYGRIPNFEGAEAAAQKLAQMQIWKSAKVLKCNPDSPQRTLRERALRERKVVYMAVPRLRQLRCFIELDPAAINANDLCRAATIKGAFQLGKQVHVSEMRPIDLIIAGSMAVNRQGDRLGKGGGYSDLEYALGRTFGLVETDTPIATTVHRIQILTEPLPRLVHDIPVDLIATADEVIETQPVFPRPERIYWQLIPEQKLASIPILQELRGGQRDSGSLESKRRRKGKVAVLLTSAPGSGKTTAIRRILAKIEHPTGGFYTEEIRQRNRRMGFQLNTLDGRKAVMAHVSIRGPYRVGKYGVDLTVIDSLAVDSLKRALAQGALVIIDEIGPMELLSEAFRHIVLEVFDHDVDVLGSIMRRSDPFADKIKALAGIQLLEVHPGNREEITELMLKMFR